MDVGLYCMNQVLMDSDFYEPYFPCVFFAGVYGYV